MKADPKQVHVEKEYSCPAPLINCRFDPTGKYVFTTAEDRGINRIDLETGKRIEFKGHDSWVRGLAFSRDGKTLITAGFDDTLIWWPATAEKPEPIRKVKAHDGWIRTISVSPDGKLIASAGNDRIVRTWRMSDGSKVQEFKGHKRDVYSTLFFGKGQFLLSGDLLGQVRVWEVTSGMEVCTLDAKDLSTFNKGQAVDYGGVRSLDLNADDSQLLCAGLHKATNPLGAVNEPLLLRFDWEKRKLLKKHEAPGVRGAAWRAMFHPDNFIFACSGGSGGGYLLFWKPDEEKPFHKFKLKDTAREMDLHPDGLRIATAHHDRKLRICRLAAKAKK